MNQFCNKARVAVISIFILASACLVSGCAPLLVGAGAVGGYEVAKHN